MRKYFSIAALFIFTLQSCQTDKRDQIIGKWEYVQININGQVIPANRMNNPTIEFKESGEVETITGNIRTEENWELKGDSIVLTSEEKPHYLKIKQITKEHLVLESEGSVKTTLTLKPATETTSEAKDEAKKN